MANDEAAGSVEKIDAGMMAAMMALQKTSMNAEHIAQAADAAVKSHEAVCAERYANIKTSLSNITLLFEKVDKIKTIVYIGVGIWVALPVIAGFMYGLLTAMKGMTNGH